MKRTGLALLSVFALAGSASAGDWTNTDAALSLGELKSRIVGNSWSGVFDGDKFSEYVDPNGELRGNSAKNGKYTAHWKLRSDGLFCFDYGKPGMDKDTDGCTQLVLKGTTVAIRRLDGVVEGTVMTAAGNAFGL